MILVQKFTHNSTLADSEPDWGTVDKTSLPRPAFADEGEAGKKSTWKYPHHWVKDGGGKDDQGIFTTGTMYLHKGGLNAAWSAAQGGRSGQEASAAVKAHLESHRKALGLSDKSVGLIHRAYSILEIKSVDTKARRFAGIASTPSTDRVGDIVEPEGAQFKLPLPFLWHHDVRDPIGWITSAKPNSKGIPIEGEIATYDEPGELQNRLTLVWQMIKAGLVRGLSIGFRALESFPIQGTHGQRITKWAWYELSAATLPINVEATITAIKSVDDRILAALGLPKTPPGVSGKSTEKGKPMKTIQEQLVELKEARQTKAARMNELAQIVKTESRDWNESETSEFSTLETEIKQLDGDIRQKTVECMNAATAKAITSEPNQRMSSPSRGVTVIVSKDKEEIFKGQNFTRRIIAKALAHLEDVSPVAIAERRWGQTNPTLVELIKTDVHGGDSTTSHWASELVLADTRYTGDFIEYLKARTLFDRLPLRVIPANVTIKGRDGAATGYWVGESAAIPATAMTFMDVSLTPLKVAALAVVTNELLRDSTPAAEMLVRDALVEASAQRIDATFLSATAKSAGVSPSGMLYEDANTAVVTPIATNGSDAAGVRADVRDLYASFITAKNASGLYFVMNPALAKSIQLLSNALGLAEFPTINQDGGTLLGDPVVTGDNVGSGDFILLKPSDIYRIGDGGVQVTVSREAMIEMATNPAMDSQTPAAPTQKTVSMFQTESTAIKIVRPINFAKRRTGVVQYIDTASFGESS
jgi:HK97 family phage major capsid protein/HK97 family phage prohead protease